VTVNGLPAHSLQLKKRSLMAADTLLITAPPGVTIGNETDVVVIIDSTAGLKNVSTTAYKTYAAFTSVEKTVIPTNLSLPAQITSFSAESKSGLIFLRWISETVLEDAYWMIERKALSALDYQLIQEGRRTADELNPPFEKIAYLQGQAIPAARIAYTYADSLVQIGAIYAYRLSDVNYEGNINYHETIYQEVRPAFDFVLFDNSPNPFKTYTSLSYSLPLEAHVNLTIFSIVGQEVLKLVDAYQAAGFYQLEWKGTNENGQQVASGLYVVSFKADPAEGGKQISKLMKIMLLR
jgi:hypothetical protein